MSREEHAREGAQAVIPDDTIVDVAVVLPRGSTFASVLGAAAGASAGSAMGNRLFRFEGVAPGASMSG